MARFLMDSHTMLWTLYVSEVLPVAVRSVLEDNTNELLISHISPWEIADKATKFRLPMAGSSADAIFQDVDELEATLLPIELEDILESIKLPRFHNDPLDRVLIAQARRVDATLLSKDGKFKQYDVRVFWG